MNSPKSNEFLTLRVYPQTLGAGQTTLKAHQEQPGDSSVHCRNCCCCCCAVNIISYPRWVKLLYLEILHHFNARLKKSGPPTNSKQTGFISVYAGLMSMIVYVYSCATLRISSQKGGGKTGPPCTRLLSPAHRHGQLEFVKVNNTHNHVQHQETVVTLYIPSTRQLKKNNAVTRPK